MLRIAATNTIHLPFNGMGESLAFGILLESGGTSSMTNMRLGDVIDDYCSKCRRLTNHAVVSIVNDQPAKVRCRSCYHDHDYLHEQIPPSKKDLKKMELFNAVVAGGQTPAASEEEVVEAEPEVEEAPAAVVPTPSPAATKKRGRAKKA